MVTSTEDYQQESEEKKARRGSLGKEPQSIMKKPLVAEEVYEKYRWAVFVFKGDI